MHRIHLLIMAIGCLLPLTVLASIFLFKVQVNSALLFGLVLLCPLSHLLMIGPIGRDHDGGLRPAHAHARSTDRR